MITQFADNKLTLTTEDGKTDKVELTLVDGELQWVVTDYVFIYSKVD